MATPVVRLVDVARTYGEGDNAVEAVRGVSLDLEAGTFYAILGPSGSGKSTLLHLAAGLDRPTRGRVEILGRDVAELDDGDLARLRRRSVGLVFQFFNLMPNLSVEENALLPVLLDRPATAADGSRLSLLLERLGIEARRSRRPDELSGGERQRAAIVRALLPGPPLLLADEPTGSLDSENGARIAAELAAVAHGEGVCVVVVTHDARVADRADRVVRLRDGRIDGAAPLPEISGARL